jgi:hypothetical protein
MRSGDEVNGVFACTRKDRLTTRTWCGSSIWSSSRTGAMPARAFRDADLLSGRFERGDLVRVQGRVERFRDELQLEVRGISRAQDADPATFMPVAYRDLDELNAFIEPSPPPPLGRCSPTSSATGPASALRRTPHPPGTTPTSAASWSTRSRCRPWPSRRARCTRVWTRTCCSQRRSSTTSARRASSPSGPRSG